jgi:hypothetical protein
MFISTLTWFISSSVMERFICEAAVSISIPGLHKLPIILGARIEIRIAQVRTCSF